MQDASAAWRALHAEKLLPECFVEISYTATEPNVWQGAQANYENAAAYGATGFTATSAAGSGGVYTDEPCVSFTWAALHTQYLPGLSLVWGGGYAVSFTVTMFHDDTAVQVISVPDNGAAAVELERNFGNYNKIQIAVSKWSEPGGTARLQSVTLGLTRVYEKKHLTSFRHTQELDLLSGTLPVSDVTFSLDNSSGVWNPENPASETRFLAQRQQVRVRYGMWIDGAVEWIPGGVMYLAEWDTPSNGLSASFTAKSAVGLLTNPYTGPRTGSLYTLASAALSQDLPYGATVSIDSSLLRYGAALPVEESYTTGAVLQLAAAAAGCVILQDRQGGVSVKPLPEGVASYRISRANSYTHPEFTLSAPLSGVNVNDGQSVLSLGADGMFETVANPLIANETQADMVSDWVAGWLRFRRSVSGEFRPDVRLDVGDTVVLDSKYNAEGVIAVTGVTYTFTGAFRGTYAGRVIERNTSNGFADEIYAMADGDILYTREE